MHISKLNKVNTLQSKRIKYMLISHKWREWWMWLVVGKWQLNVCCKCIQTYVEDKKKIILAITASSENKLWRIEEPQDDCRFLYIYTGWQPVYKDKKRRKGKGGRRRRWIRIGRRKNLYISTHKLVFFSCKTILLIQNLNTCCGNTDFLVQNGLMMIKWLECDYSG